MTSLTQQDGGQRVRLGIAGFGAAARMVVGSFANFGNFELVAAADTDPFVREQFSERYGLPTCEHFDELLERFSLDAVYIATPTRFHEPQTIAALEHGLHVLCEKPMSTTIESAQAMIAAAERTGGVLMENHKRSVDRTILSMWQLVHDGALGPVNAVHRWHYSSWFYRPRSEEERDPQHGGVVLRQGAHEFDIIRLLAPSRPVSLRGFTGDHDPARPGEGAYQAFVEFEDGALATSIYSGYDHFATEEFTFGLGDPGALAETLRAARALDAGIDEGELRRHSAPTPAARRSDPPYGFTLVSGAGGDLRPTPTGGSYLYDQEGRSEWRIDGAAGTDFIAEELYHAIADGRAPLHDGRWGLSCLELCLAVRASARSGRAEALVHQHAVGDATIAKVVGERRLTRD